MRKGITYKNGDLYYRGIKIRAEIPPRFHRNKIYSIELNEEGEPITNELIKTRKIKLDVGASWMVYYDKNPVYDYIPATPFESLLEHIDGILERRKRKNEKE